MDFDITAFNAHSTVREISIDSVLERGDGWRVVSATSNMLKEYPCGATGWTEWYWYVASTVCHQVKSRWASLPKNVRDEFGYPYWETVSRKEVAGDRRDAVTP
jgi:hypothetical protein